MQLDELIPLTKYNERNDLTDRETLAKALTGKIDIYYAFNDWKVVRYDATNDAGASSSDEKTSPPASIEIEFAPTDTLKIPADMLRELWNDYEDEHCGDFQGSCRVSHSRSLSFLSGIDLALRVQPHDIRQRPVPDLS